MFTRQGIGIKLYMYKGISMADCVTQRNSRAAIVIQWYNVLCLRWEMRSLWIGQTTLLHLAVRMLLMPNGGVGAHEEVGGGVCQGFVASMSDKGGRAWRWKSVGLMVWYLWLPTYCSYRRLSVCVIPTYSRTCLN